MAVSLFDQTLTKSIGWDEAAATCTTASSQPYVYRAATSLHGWTVEVWWFSVKNWDSLPVTAAVPRSGHMYTAHALAAYSIECTLPKAPEQQLVPY